jgi:kumamolisin
MPDPVDTGWWPIEIAGRYGINCDLDAPGQCIGIIALGGGYRPEDLKAATSAVGRPLPMVVDCPVAGAGNLFGGGTAFDEEIALDLQIVGGLVPSSRIAIYFAPNNIANLALAVRQAISDDVNRPSVLSISWGSAEVFWSTDARNAAESAFEAAARAGISIVAAAGDSLATAGLMDGEPHVLFPASSPFALACGGTQFDESREVVWNEGFSGTGGGTSDIFDLPAYQKDVAPEFLKARRGVPDVAAASGSDPGFRVIVNGRSMVKQGTSGAAPLWASLVAMANAKRGIPLGFLHPHLYGNPMLCTPIVKGNNRVDGVGFDAGPGWNACAGLGVPNARTVDGLASMP